MKDLYARVPLVIHPKLEVGLQPATQTLTKEVVVCCCFGKVGQQCAHSTDAARAQPAVDATFPVSVLFICTATLARVTNVLFISR